MINKKIVIIISIIALIIGMLVITFKVKELKDIEDRNIEYLQEEALKAEQNIIESQINEEENTVEQENITDTQNTQSDESVRSTEQNNTQTETPVQSQVEGEEEKNSKENQSSEENNDEKALRLVKEEWGEDSTVYYTIDNQSDDTYSISVRSKETTATLAEYEANISTETVFIK